MTAVLIFHPEAKIELQDAAEYYENSRVGLGMLFLDAVESALEHIRPNPLSWRVIRGNVRRCLVRRFPYSVIHFVENDRIFILAIMHLHRKPDYWQNRIQDVS